MRIKPTSVARFLAAVLLLSPLSLLGAGPRVLVYQKNGKGFVHDNLAASAAAIRELGKQHGFGVDVSVNPGVFTNMNPDIRVLLSVDTRTLKDPKLETAPGQTANGVFPLAWCHEFEGGRVFYTSLGHKIEYYADSNFRKHLLGGIRWVMGNTNATTKSNRPCPTKSPFRKKLP